MIKELPLGTVRFVGLWVETLLYGLYTVLFCNCIYVLVYRKRAIPPSRILLISAVTLFALATVLIITDFGRGYAAFITHGGTPDGPTEYYEEFWLWSNIVRECCFCAVVVVSDAVLIYRLYVVWNFKLYIVIGPVLLWLGTTAASCLVIWGQSMSKPGATLQNFDIFRWGMALFSLTFATNIIVTGLIGGRIWYYGYQTSKVLGQKHGRKYHRALIIIIESGMISALTSFLVLIFYRTTLTSADFIYFPACQIFGIVPTLIIVRVGLRFSADETTGGTLSLGHRQTTVQSNQPRETTIALSGPKVQISYHEDTFTDDLPMGRLVNKRSKPESLGHQAV